MGVRQRTQVALDLIKFTNVPNDLFDNAVPLARGQVKQPIFDEEGKGIGERDMTLEEIKEALERVARNVRGYRNMITNFLKVPEYSQLAQDGLGALGGTLGEIQGDIQSLNGVAGWVEAKLKTADSSEDLNAIADYIEKNVPKLSLVRKAK